MAQEFDLQHLSGFGELRKRYLRVALPILALAYPVRALQPSTPVATRAVCLFMLVLCIAAWMWLPRSKDGALTLTRGVVTLVVLVLLGVAWGDLPRGFPFGLVVLPGVTVFGTLLGGAWLGAGVAAIGIGATLGLLALYPLGAYPPLLVLHVSNVCFVLLVTFVFALLLARRVREGAEGLANSAAVLRATREATRRLSQDLSRRIAAAVVELQSVLDQGDDAVQRAAEATTTLLVESRRAVPPEPALAESQLETHMEELRARLSRWAFRLALLCGSAILLRSVLVPLHRAPIAVVPITGSVVAGVASLTLLDELRPRWFKPLSVVFHAFTSSALAYFTVEWLLWKPGLPPTVVLWNFLPLLATAVVGLGLGLAEVALTAVVLLVWAWPYTALSWDVPFNNALQSGLLSWLVWRAPRDLVAVLSVQRLEAAREIRARRRLVATLFHDLASPLLVVKTLCALMAKGRGEPGDRARVREMVERMRRILEAATEEASEAKVVEAGSLFDAMEALFRERLHAKRLVLRTHGSRKARVLCREALLTESVLGNLLSNALKFSPPGATIDLRVDEERDSVVLAIEDRGPGLPADVRAALSRGLASVSRPGTGGEKGNGYGLMLAQDYVREMGGALELEERTGGGLSTRIRLPAP